MQSVECLERIDRMADHLRSNQTSKLMQYTLMIIMKYFFGKKHNQALLQVGRYSTTKVALLSCENAPLDARQLA